MFYLPIPPAPPQLINLFFLFLKLFSLHHIDPTSTPHRPYIDLPTSVFPSPRFYCFPPPPFCSTFSLSKSDFSRFFHTERSWHTYRFTVVFVSGLQDLPSDARAFSLTYFEV